jgi:MFS family permease
VILYAISSADKIDPRTLGLTLVITAVSGANFFSVLMFWPTQAFNTYDQDPVGVGLRGLPIGLAIMVGCCIVLVALTILRGHVRLLMIISTVIMTIGTSLISLSTPYNMGSMYPILLLAGLGIGGILVPASIISTIVCPDDLIATVSALTLSIRVIGGAIGYAVYFNVFYNKFVTNSKLFIVPVMAKWGIITPDLIKEAIELTSQSLINRIKEIPGVHGHPEVWNEIVVAGREAYAASYKYVYYVSIGKSFIHNVPILTFQHSAASASFRRVSWVILNST